MLQKLKLRNLLIVSLTVIFAAFLLAACSGNQAQQSSSNEPAAASSENATQGAEEEAEEEENYDTGDASLDDPLNQDNIGADELLVASFGTSYNDNRRLSIGGIEKAMVAAFPDWSVRRAFTSQIIIDHVQKRDNVSIDNVKAAMERAVESKVQRLVVQPTLLMNGYEYDELVEEVAQYGDSFQAIAFGEPLLTSDADYDAVIKAITDATKSYDNGKTAIVFMGHGTEAESNQVYAKFQSMLDAGGFSNYFIGTVEATPSLDDVLAKVKEGGYTNVVLEPLMIVAGDHANNDMAGDDPESWKSTFEDAGFEVQCILQGLGEMPAIQQLLVEHAQAAIASLNA